MHTRCLIELNFATERQARAVAATLEEDSWCCWWKTHSKDPKVVLVPFSTPPSQDTFAEIETIAQVAINKTNILYRSFKGVI